jgi:hypothetical protein
MGNNNTPLELLLEEENTNRPDLLFRQAPIFYRKARKASYRKRRKTEPGYIRIACLSPAAGI